MKDRWSRWVRRILIGDPLKTSEYSDQRISNVLALAVFSSDALSSVAYGTEEILWVLVAAGMIAWSIPTHIAIIALLTILTLSYRQTIHAYPNGGGSYVVAKENLGTWPGLVAAASLLTDYTLTVAVSVSAGVAAVTSLSPVLYPFRVFFCLAIIVIVTVVNLRGIKESATVFSIPTYAFLITTVLMIIIGVTKYVTGTLHPIFNPTAVATPGASLANAAVVLILLRAFAAGCTSLTGVEAISNGVPAFHKPESKNAAKTMTWMAICLGTMALGMGFLSAVLRVIPNNQETVMSQVASAIYGRGSILYNVHQIDTLLILSLAANTSFAGFPRLGALLAQDRYVPRSMATLGDRLVFSNGILILATLASILIAIFQGEPHALLPLYAVGVFVSFTLSQAGMVIHWYKLRRKESVAVSMIINALGAVTTAVVSVIIIATKFMHGAWIVILVIPGFVLMFNLIHGHYEDVRIALKVGDHTPVKPKRRNHIAVIMIGGPTRLARRTVEYILSMVGSSAEVRAVHVNLAQQESHRLDELKRKFGIWVGDSIPLEILESPYRSLLEPLDRYMTKLRRDNPDSMISLVIPEFITSNPLANLFLHGQSGKSLYNYFRLRNYNIILVPLRIGHHRDDDTS